MQVSTNNFSLRSAEASEPFSSEMTSQTADSASFQPDAPSRVRVEDQGKIVKRHDVQAKSSIQLKASLAEIQGAVDKISAQLAGVQSAMQWRTCSRATFKIFEASFKEVEGTLSTIEDKLLGTSGVVKHIPVVVESHAFVEIIQKVQAIEIELFQLKQKQETLKALSVAPNFHDRFITAKEKLASLVPKTDDENSEEFIAYVDETITKCLESIDPKVCSQYLASKHSVQKTDTFVETISHLEVAKGDDKVERIKQRAIKVLYLEICTTCFYIAKARQENLQKAQNQLLDNTALSNQVKILNALVLHLEKDLGRKALQRKRPPVVGLGAWGNAASAIIAPVHLDQMREFQEPALQVDKSYDYAFWSHASGGYYYTLGWYKTTGRLGEEIEQTVAKNIKGLQVSLKRLIIELSQGAPIGQETLNERLNFFEACIISLEGEVDKKLLEVCQTRTDAVSKHLFDYLYGLNWGLEEARAQLKLCSNYTKKHAFALCQSLHTIQEYFQIQSPAPNTVQPNESRMSCVVKLYEALEAIKNTENQLANRKNKPFDNFLLRAAEVIHETHANKDHAFLELTADEVNAANVVLYCKPLDSLYTGYDLKGEQLLPQVLLQYIAKRMIAFMFFPSEPHDMELELVLSIVFKKYEELYFATLAACDGVDDARFRAYGGLRELFGMYERTYKKQTPRESLGLPAKIAELAMIAKEPTAPVLAYLEGWQKLVEYKKSGSSSSVECMYQVLSKRLNESVVANDYDVMYPIVVDTDIEAWKIQEHAAFLQTVQSTNIKPNLLFGSIVLRLLGACLFARDIHEEMKGQELLNIILATPAFEEYVDELSDDVKLLIAHNVIKKINNTYTVDNQYYVPLPKEEEFFYTGPLDQFFNDAFVTPDIKGLEMAIYLQIRREGANGKLLQECADRFRDKLRDWGGGFEALSQGNPTTW